MMNNFLTRSDPKWLLKNRGTNLFKPIKRLFRGFSQNFGQSSETRYSTTAQVSTPVSQQRGLLLLLGFVHLNQSFPVESPTHQPRWPSPAQNKQLEQDKNFRQEFDIKKRASCLENVLKPSELVLNTIKCCYVIPFVKDPLLLFKKNNRLAHDNSKFVEDAINDYLTTIV